jgi:hypothetical protein
MSETPFRKFLAAQRAAEAAPILLGAVTAALLFHSDSPWTPEKRTDWRELTGSDEATTKVLCDTLRAAQAAALGHPTEDDR